jgi:MFS family permease
MWMTTRRRWIDALARLPRNVWALSLTSLLTDISSEMVLSLLPLLLVSVLGVRTGVVGLIEGVAEASASLLKLGSGWLSDRLLRRKPLVVTGYGLSAFARPFLLVAGSWAAVLAVRFADRVGKGLRSAPKDALLAESTRPEQRGLAFGLHRAADTIGAVLGLAVALVVVLLGGQTQALTEVTFRRVVLVSILPALLALFVVVLGTREVLTPGRAASTHGHHWRSLGTPFLLYLGTIALFTLGNSSDAFLILRASSVGLTVSGVLVMLIGFNLVYALVSTPAGALSDRVGRKRVLLVGWILYCVVYLGFAMMQAPLQAIGLMCLYGVYYGLVEGVSRALVADLVPADRRGTAYGMYAATVGLMLLPASLIAGVLWQGLGAWGGLGPSAPFVFGAALAGLALFLLSLQSLRPASSASSEAP